MGTCRNINMALLAPEDRPVIDRERNTISFRPRILNPYITCSLCMGYFRNATTITECMHTYCRSCIIRYFQESKKDCPVCGHDLSPYPLEMIRHDHMTQSIINKMLANDWTPAGGDDYHGKEASRPTRGGSRGSRPAEMLEFPDKAKRRKRKSGEKSAKAAKAESAEADKDEDAAAPKDEPDEEAAENGEDGGEPAEDGADEPSDEEEDEEEDEDDDEEEQPEPEPEPEEQDEEEDAEEALPDAKKGKEADAAADVTTPAPKTAASDVNFSLIHDEAQDAVPSKLGVLQKPYLRTCANISILQLKKYLKSKFFGDEAGPQIKLMCRGQLCEDQMSVGDISVETWKDSSKDLELVYCSIE